MLNHLKINRNDLPDSWPLGVLEFRNSRQLVHEKLKKQSLWLFWGRLKRLVCHSASRSEILGLLCHVLVLHVEYHMLLQLLLIINFVML
jgi:hypothetical protein